MRLTMGLSMQQQQRLIMTPELRQAITVLQLPMMELKEYLEQEMLNNPALEAEEDEVERTAPEPEPEPEPEAQPTTAEWLEYLGDYTGDGAPVRSRSDEPSLEGFIAQATTLHDHLRAQLQLAELTHTGRRVGEYLIGNIDDHGYLSVEPCPVATALGVPIALVEQVLAVVQSFDPPGVGARTLQECLCLQWTHVNGTNPLVLPIIDRHLDDLAAGRISRIADALGTSPAAVQVAVDEIRTLDPKPGRRFGSGETRYVLPDAAVERVDGDYVVLVNDVLVPRLQVSPVYRSLLSAHSDSDAETKGFVEHRVKAAQWLIRSVEHRRNTLYRVVESVVRLQRPFFDRGVRYLRPLTLRQVAERIGTHESTVSRAIAGKYIQSPQGLFELSFFFTSGVEGHSGEGVAAESVKRRIGDLVAAEPPGAPLSDQALTDALVRQGLQISRRTVAKYREEMGLPASLRRRRYS